MYNWIDDLNEIYDILEANDYLEIKEQLFNAQLSGGTGWEIFLLICDELMMIREKQSVTYYSIREQAERIIEYGINNKFISKK